MSLATSMTHPEAQQLTVQSRRNLGSNWPCEQTCQTYSTSLYALELSNVCVTTQQLPSVAKYLHTSFEVRHSLMKGLAQSDNSIVAPNPGSRPSNIVSDVIVIVTHKALLCSFLAPAHLCAASQETAGQVHVHLSSCLVVQTKRSLEAPQLVRLIAPVTEKCSLRVAATTVACNQRQQYHTLGSACFYVWWCIRQCQAMLV